MKPTVISGGSGGQNPTPTAANNQQAQPNSGTQYPTQDGGSTREFPHFQSGFGGFRPHFDDMFDDDDFGPHLRARMMRDPFAAFGGRKRCGYKPFDDPYRDYFADLSDFFPGFHDPEWDTLRSSGRRRAAAPQTSGSNNRGNIFDHIPAQFRSYIPDNFGMHSPAGQEYSQSYPPHQQHYEQPQSHPQPQQYQSYPEPPLQQQQYHQQQQAPRPKYCDASIQTDQDAQTDNQGSHPNQNLNQHNLRNTVDMGQKTQSEGTNETRSHSAPPVNNQNYTSASTSAYVAPGHPQGTYYASTGTDPQTPQQFVQQQNPDFNVGHPAPPPPPQRHHVPPQCQQAPQYQQTPQYQQQPQQAPSRGSNSPQGDGGFVRHVPIFIEGRSDPVNPPQQQQQPQHQQQPHQQQPQQQRKVPPQQQKNYEQHQRPTPLNTQQAQAHAQMNAPNNNQVPQGTQGAPEQVPQTPHTTECISKIQDIQRDVLNLLGHVEQFAGTKNDKEYLYLDEMLTRNLLKLDTIDTNGKDSIRLARREAIKCIQASINVLEAKAEENAKTAQGSVIEPQQTETRGGEANVIPLPSNEAQSPQVETTQSTVDTSSNDNPTSSQEIKKSASSKKASSFDAENKVPEDKQSQSASTEIPKTAEQPSGLDEQSITTNSQNSESTEQSTTTPEEANADQHDQTKQPEGNVNETTLEPPKDQVEKSSSEKENKPPGSPKKKIVRKVKKVPADKKSVSPAPDETAASNKESEGEVAEDK